MRLLLVEDHPEIAEWVGKALLQAGYRVDHVSQGDHADQLLRTESYDGVILDLSLPKMDGIEVLRRARHRGVTVPILILTARGSTEDRVHGLNLGADDYLPKPFELAELEARIKALLRRSSGQTPIVHIGRLSFDTTTRQVSMDSHALQLTPRELAVFEALAAKLGKPVSREALFETIFAFDAEARSEAIEIYVHRLRKKIEGSGAAITTLRGLGYVLNKDAND